MSKSSQPPMASARSVTPEELAHDAQLHRHLHLEVVQTPPHDRVRRLAVLGLSVVAGVLFMASLAQPWWKLKLYAPQYPHGLTLIISLTGMSGDVHEIDMLNHYIGMAHLDAAASLERHYAHTAVLGLCLALVTLTLLVGRRLGWTVVALGALFPVVFLADSYYWLYHFGHNLDRRAPLHIPEFTPQLFGNGSIGQFMTFAVPQLGFWLASAGVLVLSGLVYARRQVCASCNQRGTCGAVCRSGFVFKAAEAK